jgi:hypothetical protein
MNSKSTPPGESCAITSNGIVLPGGATVLLVEEAALA